MLFFPSERGPSEMAALHEECSQYPLSVSRVSQCVISASAKVIDSQCLGLSGQRLVHAQLTHRYFYLIWLSKVFFSFLEWCYQKWPKISWVNYRPAPASLFMCVQLHSVPVATWKQSKRSRVPSHIWLRSRTWEQTSQEFCTPSLSATIENLSMLLPAPKGPQTETFCCSSSKNRSVTQGIRESCLYAEAFSYRPGS